MMPTLTSASSFDDAKASYVDNASYFEDASLAKARAFITACRVLLLLLPKRAAKSGEELEMDPRLLAEQIGEAQRFVGQYHTAAASPKIFSIENLRD